MISLVQLQTLGFSYKEIQWRVSHGQLHRLHHGVYAVGHTRLTHHAHLLAALLSAGPTAFLSHRTAAAVYGLRVVNLHRIELTVPGARRRSRPPLALHTAAPEAQSRMRDGLRVSTIPQMLVELAALETADELNRLITEAARKRLLQPDKLAAALARHERCRGVGRLRAAADRYLPRPDRRSGLERAFDELLGEHPEIAEPARNVKLAGWELDCYWSQTQLVIELDGRAYHQALADMEKDRYKDAQLLRLGIRVLRITDRRFEEDRAGVTADVLALTPRR